jgi:ribosomal-protein-serine acetyltransferase
MNRVQIHCATDNTRSRAIPERLAFQQEGIIREALWVNYRFVDLAIYSILAREWPTH